MFMNGWAGQRMRHPSGVFGNLLLQSGSHVGALPWHLVCRSLPQTFMVYPKEVQICSPRVPHAWLAVAMVTRSSKKPLTQTAKTPSPTNPGHSQILFYS